MHENFTCSLTRFSLDDTHCQDSPALFSLSSLCHAVDGLAGALVGDGEGCFWPQRNFALSACNIATSFRDFPSDVHSGISIRLCLVIFSDNGKLLRSRLSRIRGSSRLTLYGIPKPVPDDSCRRLTGTLKLFPPGSGRGLCQLFIASFSSLLTLGLLRAPLSAPGVQDRAAAYSGNRCLIEELSLLHSEIYLRLSPDHFLSLEWRSIVFLMCDRQPLQNAADQQKSVSLFPSVSLMLPTSPT